MNMINSSAAYYPAIQDCADFELSASAARDIETMQRMARILRRTRALLMALPPVSEPLSMETPSEVAAILGDYTFEPEKIAEEISRMDRIYAEDRAREP